MTRAWAAHEARTASALGTARVHRVRGESAPDLAPVMLPREALAQAARYDRGAVLLAGSASPSPGCTLPPCATSPRASLTRVPTSGTPR